MTSPCVSTVVGRASPANVRRRSEAADAAVIPSPLAYVVIGGAAARRGRASPAEENIANGLHQMLTSDNALTLVAVFALTGVFGHH